MDASALESAEYWLSWIGTAKLIGAFLVAVGVAAEFFGDWVAKPFEATVESARTQQIASLTADAEASRAQIAEANAKTAQAQRDLAILQRQAHFRLPEGGKMVPLLKLASGNVEILFGQECFDGGQSLERDFPSGGLDCDGSKASPNVATDRRKNPPRLVEH